MDLSGRKFVVVGAGRSGAALTRFLLDRGVEVVLNDQRTQGLDPAIGELARRGAKLALGAHDPALLEGADQILVSPGVPLALPALETARGSGVPVMGEIEFASRFLKGRIIGITGTNGKSTTTTLTGVLLREGGVDATACGNLGTPLIEMVAGDAPSRTYVVELSSFQLEGIESFRPAIAVLLNVAPDHQDRYADHAAYRAAKGRIFENQGAGDEAVLNRDDPEAMGFAAHIKPHVSLFSAQASVADGACVESGRIVTRRDGKSLSVLPVDALPLVGVHNLENALASVAVASRCGVTPESMAASIRRFRGLPHRMELVATLGTVRYFNDSKATNVAATLRSLESFPGGIVLILGGKDKGGDFAALLPLIRQKAAALVLMGKARESIHRQLGEPVPTRLVATMEEAIAAAAGLAPARGVVLLAPACASFDAYRNFEERGEDFKRRVLELAGGAAGPAGGR